MLSATLHRVVANPWVYDQVQTLAGARLIRRHIAAHLAGVRPTAVIVDVGGGTGAMRDLTPPSCTYVCLDSDAAKLGRSRKRRLKTINLLGDATRAPIGSGTVDVVLSLAMSHHIGEGDLNDLFEESRRILKNDGTMIFLDAVWNPRRPVGKLIWRYDRGAFPRSRDALTAALSAHFTPTHQQRLAFWHEYLLWVGKPRDDQ